MKSSLQPSQPPSSPKKLREVMRQHPLFFFFLMSYAFAWIISIPYVLSTWNILPGDYTIAFILKPFVGPTLAAIIMTGLTEGRAGLRHLRDRLRHRWADWWWYLFILLGIPVLILLGIVIQPGTLASFQGLTPNLLWNYPVYFVAVFFGVALPEEIGWRGFALPRMQPRYGPLRGTLLLGLLWALWHLLYFLTPDHGGGPYHKLLHFFPDDYGTCNHLYMGLQPHPRQHIYRQLNACCHRYTTTSLDTIISCCERDHDQLGWSHCLWDTGPIDCASDRRSAWLPTRNTL